MILLHGGMSYEMFAAIIGGFFGAVAVFVLLCVMFWKSTFYKETFAGFETGAKAIGYFIFFVLAGFISLIACWFFAFLFAWVATLLS
ncbi:hypothetical protein KK083_30855 [Fulvivirgaceae bacterium PWU4]|uniref:Uncharacterized protein n=1 Tax=Chryseosolibacter histidini TaxID=2782349 RepID=A0AAP2GRM2_9BACT|nr:hypothetical protein [Chryseosolibacter histidini]MBT1701333.1 hypothetical protein [Chryseosolibacter histidini]